MVKTIDDVLNAAGNNLTAMLNIKKEIIIFILMISLIINSIQVIALTPYKIDIKELPLTYTSISAGSSPGSITFYDNIIAYKSDYGEISIYNLKTNENKVIAKSVFLLDSPYVYKQLVLYMDNSRLGSKLIKHNLLTGEEFILSDSFRLYNSEGQTFTISEDKFIAPGFTIDLSLDIDYPPMQPTVYCNTSGSDPSYFKDNGYIIRPEYKQREIVCLKCNILSGEIEELPNSYKCYAEISTACGKGKSSNGWVWAASSGNRICLFNSTQSAVSGIFEESDIILKQMGFDGEFAVYGEKIVLLRDGRMYLGEIKYGNLTEICESYSSLNSIKNGNFEVDIQSKCTLSNENSCSCNFKGFHRDSNFIPEKERDFSPINLDETRVNQIFEEVSSLLISEINNYNLKLEQERLLKEKEEREKAERTRNWIIVSLVIIGLALFGIKRLNKERVNKLNEEKEKLAQEKEEKRFRQKQKEKGLIEYKGLWGSQKEVRYWAYIDECLDSNFQNLNPYDFEEFIAELFEKMGYKARRTPGSGDYGADVIAKKDNEIILIQTKRYKEGNNVTPEDVQRTLGAMHKYHAKKSVLITTSSFTVRAKTLERDAPIELWDKKNLHETVKKCFFRKEKIRE